MDFQQFQRMVSDLGYYWLNVNQSLPPEAFFVRGSARDSAAVDPARQLF
jgi:hypothetical protein